MHKYIIGILWIVFGTLIFSTVLVSMNESRPIVSIVGYPMSFILIAGGFALLASRFRYRWLCHLCGGISLLMFPVGTVLGVYYFWSYYTFRNNPVA